MIVNRQIRTKNLGQKEFLARRKKEKNDEQPDSSKSDKRLHDVSEEENSRKAGSDTSSDGTTQSSVAVLQEGAQGTETQKELVNENGTVATEEKRTSR